MPGEALPRACIDAGECQRRAIIEAVRRETVEASAKAIEATILDPDSLGADLKRRCAAIVRGAAIRAASSPVGSAREAADSSGSVVARSFPGASPEYVECVTEPAKTAEELSALRRVAKKAQAVWEDAKGTSEPSVYAVNATILRDLDWALRNSSEFTRPAGGSDGR